MNVVEPFENARLKFDVRFYLVAILFVIFDLVNFFISLGSRFSVHWNVGILVNDVISSGFNCRFLYEWKKGL